ncbi:MAG: response regulator, partial [Duncaniella sp.]|nr:response regulator [Duncaniella sp.]
LTELHHGTISGRNRTDGTRGSEFIVTIPVFESAYAPSELQHEPDNEDETSGYASIRNDRNLVSNELSSTSDDSAVSRRRSIANAKRILIVDDDTELRQYINRHLEELGYKTVTASDGSQAMKIVTEDSIDLVVCDVKMPVMDGLTFLRLVRNNINLHHIPVIILSSKSDIADRIEGWDRGADGYLSKPFSISELDSLIDSLIDNRLRLKGKYSGVQDTESSTPVPEIKGYDETLMERIISIINDNIDNPGLNVEMLGQSAGISRVHLHRKLKDLIGMTPSNFIRNTRLKQACILLQKPDVEVTQIAYAVGFTSQTYFSTAFKKFTGFSPSEYRAKYLSGELRSEPSPEESDT